MMRYTTIGAIFIAGGVIANAERAQAQASLPSGAHVRFGTIDFLAGSGASAIACTPDEKPCASGGGEGADGEDENSVAIWSTTTVKRMKTFTGHRAQVRLLPLSPDGRMLASGIDDALDQEKENSPVLAESILVCDVQGRENFRPDAEQNSEPNPTLAQRLLVQQGYSLQSSQKIREVRQHPDRDGQFRRIGERVAARKRRGEPG